jgi:hypothetical protein
LRAVIVNRVDDPAEALQGVLWQNRGAWLTLREVSLLRPNTEPARIDGEVVIHRDKVAFIQVLPS